MTSSGEGENVSSDRRFQVALRYYDYASNQMGLSLRQRDSTTLLYLAAVGGLFGTALSGTVNIALLVLIPFVSVGAAVLVMLHHVRVGALSSFREELDEEFRDLSTEGNWPLPKHLDSPAILGVLRDSRLLRTSLRLNQVIATAVLLIAPAILSGILFALLAWDVDLGLTDPPEVSSDILRIGGSLVSLICVALVGAVLVTSTAVRKDLYDWQEEMHARRAKARAQTEEGASNSEHTRS